MVNRRAPVTCSYCLAGEHRRCVGACACTVCRRQPASDRVGNFPNELDADYPARQAKIGCASPTPPGTFSGPQVCKAVGITYRQLDYWARTELLRPSVAEPQGSGWKRLYSADDLRLAHVIRKLVGAGVSLFQARKVVPLLRGDDDLRWLVISDGQPLLCAAETLEEHCVGHGATVVVDLERAPPAA